MFRMLRRQLLPKKEKTIQEAKVYLEKDVEEPEELSQVTFNLITDPVKDSIIIETKSK